jgi:hypothetical protein
MELVYFDKEFYLEKVLKKLQFALEFDEFKKDSILRILGFLSSAVVSCPVASQSIYWIVPKIIKEFDNAANQATVQEVSTEMTSADRIGYGVHRSLHEPPEARGRVRVPREDEG